MLAKALGADLSALFFSADGLDPRSMGFSGKLIEFGAMRPVSYETGLGKGFRQIYLKYRVLFHTKFLREYDTVIFSNDSLSAIRNVRAGARKIYYAHSIPRYLFDQREFYYGKVPFLLRPIYILIRAVSLKMLDGKVDPPAFNLRNDILVAKHAHAALITRLFQRARGLPGNARPETPRHIRRK